MNLSREELDKFTSASVDPSAPKPVRKSFENVDLTDEELVHRLKERTGVKPTFLLRQEYERRLKQRGI